MFKRVKFSFSFASINNDNEVVETAINMEHIKELIRTRGINGANRKSSHSNLKKETRIKCVQRIPKKIRLAILMIKTKSI